MPGVIDNVGELHQLPAGPIGAKSAKSNERYAFDVAITMIISLIGEVHFINSDHLNQTFQRGSCQVWAALSQPEAFVLASPNPMLLFVMSLGRNT
jgi:hypothetical protein